MQPSLCLNSCAASNPVGQASWWGTGLFKRKFPLGIENILLKIVFSKFHSLPLFPPLLGSLPPEPVLAGGYFSSARRGSDPEIPRLPEKGGPIHSGSLPWAPPGCSLITGMWSSWLVLGQGLSSCLVFVQNAAPWFPTRLPDTAVMQVINNNL